MDGPGHGRTYSVDRLRGLSDGVIAVAMTLLVLDLKVPPGLTDPTLHRDLIGQVPNFIAWVVSFALLARFWTIHHVVLDTLEECHTSTIGLNFLLLGGISLVPFATSLIGRYELHPIAVLLFSAVVGAVGMLHGLLARHVERHPHLHKRGPMTDVSWYRRYQLVGPPAFAVGAALLALISPVTALLLWITEPPVAALFGRRHRYNPAEPVEP